MMSLGFDLLDTLNWELDVGCLDVMQRGCFLGGSDGWMELDGTMHRRLFYRRISLGLGAAELYSTYFQFSCQEISPSSGFFARSLSYSTYRAFRGRLFSKPQKTNLQLQQQQCISPFSLHDSR
ncbi:uncharacterized protein H6S33_003794 [Morchella sextelata]|uniref:uncharacterized protein n=1 Tax=Morchella sextelata TaxID=1174677 RepID=UPI001D05AE42|nr:uncharacterized protein H6S33_003794 [Morchella sextelata]KAH0606133.1 hypothetical protein H6S33_003794 [Morchella sextelata]